MLTLKDAIEKFCVDEDPMTRVYGRAMAAMGDGLQGWINDEVGRDTSYSDILSTMVRLMASMTASMTVRIPGVDTERGIHLLAEMYEEVAMACHRAMLAAPGELLATVKRAEAQMREVGQSQ